MRRFDPSSLIWYLPTKNNKEVNRSLKFLKQFIENLINNYKVSDNQKGENNQNNRTHIEEVIIASLEENSQLSKAELIDYIATLLFAAFDTTSTNLLFTIYYIAKYQHYQEMLRKEIKEKFPLGYESILKATIDDILNLPFLNDFMNEVNRLYTIASVLSRSCIKDTVIQNYQFKKGYEVFIDNTMIGQDKDYWNGMEDLHEFRPERWKEFSPPTLKRAMPFGFGGRICPAKNFANAELKAILVFLLKDYVITLRNPNEDLKLAGQQGIMPDISVNFNNI